MKKLVNRYSSLWATICFSLISIVSAHAAEKTIVLKDHIGLTWTNEFVSYPMQFDKGACGVGSLAVVSGGKTIPAQLTDVELWPGTQFVKKANVAFVVDTLTPQATNNYSVRFAASGTPAKPASDLGVKPADGSVEISTAKVSVKMALGEKTFDPPASAKDVPGPLLSLRNSTGNWAGGSALYGDVTVKSWSSKLIEQGPVVATVESRYELTNGTVAVLTSKVVAGDSAVLWSVNVKGDSPDAGVDLQFGRLPGVKEAQIPKTWGQWGMNPKTLALTGSPKSFGGLSPNTSVANIWKTDPTTVRLISEGGPDIQLASRNIGAWGDPVKPLTYGGIDQFDLEMIPKAWSHWQRRRLPLTYTAEGDFSMKVSFVGGQRFWNVSNGLPVVGERLNVVKDYVLDWPAKPGLVHPHLFMSKEEVHTAWKNHTPDQAQIQQLSAIIHDVAGYSLEAYLLSNGDKEVAVKARTVQQFKGMMAMLADYDVMRYGVVQLALYDALINTDLLTPDEKKLYRSQMALFGYRMADPMMWSIERGMHSGNPNMSISYTLTLGLTACLIPDHPMAKTWSDYATAWMNKWLTDCVGPNGEWKLEGAGYSQVSLTPLIAYAVAARGAGFHDFLSDPRFRKLMMYEAKHWTPADPQRNSGRVSPAVGRGTSGNSTGLFGIVARATAKSDPELSKTMQWMWQKSNYNDSFGDWRMGGFEIIYRDRKLPAETPKWGSELFPSQGVIFRNGVGDPAENYLNILATNDSTKNLDIWTPEIGAVAHWHALGKPVAKQFAFAVGYNERHELMRNGVALARNWGAPGDSKLPFGYYTTATLNGFSALDRVDYVGATYNNTKVDDRDWFPENVPAFPKVTAATSSNLRWTRQSLFMKDDAPGGPHYLVLRDTTKGGQPTTWQFWTLSEKVGTPDQVKDANFLADKPGEKILPARELPAGNRYTVIGQFGIDLDYYIANPTNTPRSTLRYGGAYNHIPEYQDVMHLQLPGDGAYFVAIFPHMAGTVAPAFNTLGDGKIIKVAGAFGTDYSFLSDIKADAKDEQVIFSGTAGAVQDRAGSVVLALSAPGSVGIRDLALTASIPVSARIEAQTAKLTLAKDGKGGDVTLKAPGAWKLAKAQKGVKVIAKGGVFTISVPAGTQTVSLEKGR